MRILAVDDDYVSRTKLKALLSAHGDCDAVPNGEIALEMFACAHREGAAYDVVTMDVNMPGMRGQEVVARIRTWEKNHPEQAGPGVKILMITAVKGGQEVMSAFREGCEWYLVKPVTPENLREGLDKLEDAHRQRVEINGRQQQTVIDSVAFPDAQSMPLNGVDQEFWADYRASTQSNLEQLEAAAMALEEGAEEQADAVKRLLHSLKGEAGMIGLNDVQEVLHQAETGFEELGGDPSSADMVLTVRDWVETVLEQIEARFTADAPAE